MKITKTQLADLIKETVLEQMDKTISPKEVDHRISRLDRLRQENNLNTYEILEDVLEQVDEETWKEILQGINYKYGHLTKNKVR